MLRVWLIFLALIATTWLGLKIQENPGILYLNYAGFSIEMPLWVAIIGTVISVAILYVALSFLLNIFSFFKRVKEKWVMFWLEKKNKKIQDSFLALAIEDWKSAEKNLLQGIKKDNKAIKYIAAAKDAQNRGNIKEANSLLEKAYDSKVDKHEIDLVKSKFLYDNKDYDSCILLLNSISDKSKNLSALYRLLFKCYKKKKEWKNILSILSKLKRYSSLDVEELEEIELETYIRLIPEYKDDFSEFKYFWSNIPKEFKLNKELSKVSSFYFNRNNQPKKALELLKQSIEKEWDEELVRLYSIIDYDNKSQFKQLKSWYEEHSDSNYILLPLASLAIKNNSLEEAEKYLNEKISNFPCMESYAELGKLKELQGDLNSANSYYRDAVSYYYLNKI